MAHLDSQVAHTQEVEQQQPVAHLDLQVAALQAAVVVLLQVVYKVAAPQEVVEVVVLPQEAAPQEVVEVVVLL